jgi:hypothetical protein
MLWWCSTILGKGQCPKHRHPFQLEHCRCNDLPDADWSVEKAILKEKSNIAPANIVAKVQLEWPSKTFGITSAGNVAMEVFSHLSICAMHPQTPLELLHGQQVSPALWLCSIAWHTRSAKLTVGGPIMVRKTAIDSGT